MRNSRKLTHKVLALTALVLSLAIAGWQAPTLMAYSNQMVKAVRTKLDRTPAKTEIKAAAAAVAPMQTTKEEKHARMKVLQAQIASSKGQPGQQATLDAAMAELKQISDSLGGDLPANEGPSAPGQTGGPLAIGVIPPAGTGCVLTTTVTTQSTPTAIPTGPAVVTSTVAVAGAGPVIWDVNLRTFITHTFAADLDITIQSPAGTIVTLTTDNGAGNDDVFNGTVWDDDANPAGQVPYTTNNGLVTDHAYANLTLASPLVPEEAMAAFNGENPNGTWTITISDDLAGDGGSLASWDLEISTLPAAPTTATTSATQSTPVAIPTGPAVVSSTVVVAGAGASLSKLTLLTNLTHTFAADLDITLQSPAGTVVTLTTDNGAGNDNTFNGTLWDDDANPAGQVPYTTNNGLATDHAYVNLTTATPLVPEEAMGAFIGENPNGTWTITISDDLAGDGGSLDSWTVNATTASCASPCTLTCPANITVSNAANQCGATVTYAVPTTTGTCGTVTCSPASGTFFPVGTTTVTCT
ncbi:MAG: proprotein convertase P-domain-containing protein, partial [Blastocatellia bacterium]